MRRAIYPGSFDPITNGHLDIIDRATMIFDELIIAITSSTSKKGMFSLDERLSMIESIVEDNKKIKVIIFEGLLIDFAKNYQSSIIIRGLRVLSDFEYEFKMALMNRSLDSNINTLFMMPHEKYTHISSSLVKEVTLLGGNVSQYVPQIVQNKLLQKVKNN
tara:strand:- start:1216 stop:1698 length:483 start_codon:yes stop_codon:yes gene_type:complete